MTKEMIVSEFVKGSTIESLAKQYQRAEKERINTEYKSKKGKPTISVEYCRMFVADVILREVWHKIYADLNN